tara:strand:+ start:34056 stop:35246 length:1191 start_codon:yes stop_codon:yes gene_type:complete
MAKKKYTDEEYLKFLNDELERVKSQNTSNSETLQDFAGLDLQAELDIIKELNNREGDASGVSGLEAARRASNVAGFGRVIDPNLGPFAPNDTLRLNPDGQGTFQSEPLAPTINFISGQGETKLTSKNNNAAIIMGFDRPSTLASGKGGKGSSRANTIDIVVGRMSCKQEQISEGKIKAVDPNFFCDASRIYISQLTDVDLNFGVVPGVSGRSDAMMGKSPASRAAIGIKSDKVRIIGSEGVKIVTGRSYAALQEEKNSLGGKIPRAAPIELIAGNVDGTRKIWGGLFNTPQSVQLLQGVPYGENLTDCLLEMQESIGLLMGCVQKQAQMFQLFARIFSLTPFWGLQSLGATISALLLKMFVNNSVHHLRINSKLVNIGYLSPAGAKYIVSQNVFTT